MRYHKGTFYNAGGGSNNASGIFQNVTSGWTFTAKGIIQYIDGTIEWNHSTDGRFEKVSAWQTNKNLFKIF